MVATLGCRINTMKAGDRHARIREQPEDVRFPCEQSQRVLHEERLDERPKHEGVRPTFPLDFKAAHL